MVESEDGKKTLLSATNPKQRRAIAKKLLARQSASMPLGQNKKVFLLVNYSLNEAGKLDSRTVEFSLPAHSFCCIGCMRRLSTGYRFSKCGVTA